MIKVTLGDDGFVSKTGTIIPTYQVDTGKKRFPLPRINTVLKTLSSPGINHWTLKQIVSDLVQVESNPDVDDLIELLLSRHQQLLSSLGEASEARKEAFFEGVKNNDDTRPDVRAFKAFKEDYGLDPGGLLNVTVGRLFPNYAGQLDALCTVTEEGEEPFGVAIDITLKSPEANTMQPSQHDTLRAAGLAWALPECTPLKLPEAVICLRIDPESGEWKATTVASTQAELLKEVEIVEHLAQVYLWRKGLNNHG